LNPSACLGGEKPETKSFVNLTKKKVDAGVVVVELAGYVRMGPDCKQLTNQVDELIRDKETRVVFDLSGVDLIDSAGIGTIVLCFSRLKKAGGSLRIAGAKGMVDTVLHTTQVHRAISLFPAVADAVKDFSAGAEPSPPQN
jgi:anti-sigma B factor antagonist